MVRVVGFGAVACVTVAALFVAFRIVFFHDGLGFRDLLVLPSQDDAAHGSGGGYKCVSVMRKIGGRDLDAVEEESGMARIDGSGGKGGEDAPNGDLDGEAVFDWRQFEWRYGCRTILHSGSRFTLRKVIVAEVLGGQGGGAATASTGADVTAELIHGIPPAFDTEMLCFL